MTESHSTFVHYSLMWLIECSKENQKPLIFHQSVQKFHFTLKKSLWMRGVFKQRMVAASLKNKCDPAYGEYLMIASTLGAWTLKCMWPHVLTCFVKPL